MQTSSEQKCPVGSYFIFILYSIFGCAVCFLWSFDYFRYEKQIFSICGVILLVIGNFFQLYLSYQSLINKKIIKFYSMVAFLIILICGISIYVSMYGADRHFSIFTVASIITQILFALYGISFILGKNQKRKDKNRQSQNLEEHPLDDANRSVVILYDPELPDMEPSDSSCQEEDSDEYEKSKYFHYGIKKDKSEDEDEEKYLHFKYPQQIEVSDDSTIEGVVEIEETNPYASNNLEIYGVSMQV